MTLRTRLLIGLAAILVTLGVSAYVVIGSQRTYLVRQVDRQLEGALPVANRLAAGRARAVATRDPNDASGATGPDRPPAGAGGGGFGFVAQALDSTDSPFSELYVGQMSATGVLTASLRGGMLEGRPKVTLADVQRFTVPGGRGLFTVDGTDTSSRFRVRVLPRTVGSGWLVLALPLTRVDSAVDRLLIAFGISALVVLAVGALAAWWVVRIGLRPIQQMTVAADAVAAGARGQRVSFADPRTETGRLGRAFNVMLDARQGAEDRLRRFVADASHELRTPITSIRGYVELYRQHGLDDPGRLDDAMTRMGQEAERMGGLVEDLLLLANLDQGRPLDQQAVDVGQILNDAAADALATQPGRQVTLSAPGPGELLVEGDEARLRQVVGALVHNALVHTDVTAGLALSAHHEAGRAVIEVSDHGQGMTSQEAAKAFERFYRGDPSRSRHRGGSGLGLSIAQSIVEAHGGQIDLVTSPGQGCRFTVVLPATDPVPSAQPGGPD
jgi:two-component system OmpR family sensor kinase